MDDKERQRAAGQPVKPQKKPMNLPYIGKRLDEFEGHLEKGRREKAREVEIELHFEVLNAIAHNETGLMTPSVYAHRAIQTEELWRKYS